MHRRKFLGLLTVTALDIALQGCVSSLSLEKPEKNFDLAKGARQRFLLSPSLKSESKGKTILSVFDLHDRESFRIPASTSLSHFAVPIPIPNQSGRLLVLDTNGPLASIIDLQERREMAVLHATENRVFGGHGAFAENHGLVFTTESHFPNGSSVIVYRESRSLKPVLEITVPGSAAHDIVFSNDQRSLFITAGTYIAELEISSGRILRTVPFRDAHINIRHLAVGAENDIFASTRCMFRSADYSEGVIARMIEEKKYVDLYHYYTNYHYAGPCGVQHLEEKGRVRRLMPEALHGKMLGGHSIAINQRASIFATTFRDKDVVSAIVFWDGKKEKVLRVLDLKVPISNIIYSEQMAMWVFLTSDHQLFTMESHASDPQLLASEFWGQAHLSIF